MEEKTIHEINDYTAPSLIEHFIGQERVKQLVKTALEASWMDGNRLPHMIYSGPPGVGKSQLASILAKETGVELMEQLAQNLSGISDVQGFLLQAKERSILLIDEIDQLGKIQQVTLLRALENGKLFLTSGHKKKTTTIKLEPFTLIACTNFPECLLKPLQDRFKMTLPFTWYSKDEIKTILKNRVVHLKWDVEEEVYEQIGLRSRGTPRISLKILESIRRTARANGDTTITLHHLNLTLKMEGIDSLGLTIDERKYLSIVNDHNNLIRLNVIATCLGVSSRSVSINVEPYLIRIGLLTKDPRNGCRVLTNKGMKHITENPVE